MLDYDKALDVPWRSYRIWAATSRYIKGDLDAWNRRTLWLAITGAVLAAAGQEFGATPLFEEWPQIPRSVAVLASFAVALAAYFGKEMLTGSRTAEWIKARSAAESLKASTFLYRAQAPPYNTADREKLLFQHVDSVEQSVAAIQTRAGAPETGAPDLSPLTVDDYIAKRVDDQVKYYDGSAGEYQAKNDGLRNLVLMLGAASVLLGLLAATHDWIPALVALVATLTASVSAQSQHQQYQTLIATYQATSRRLMALKGEWIASHTTDADMDARNSFIRSCEDALATENGGWVARFSQAKPVVAGQGGGNQGVKPDS